MEYYYEGNQLHCAKCKNPISKPEDRHACYWEHLANEPIGCLAGYLFENYQSYNKFEKRIAKQIWERKKIEAKPKKLKHLKFANTTNVEVYEAWVQVGDDAVNE